MLFNKFPREIGPPRKIVNNLCEWLKFVNLYNGKKKAVYTSIYIFNNIDSKPNYDSAVIDKLFFDFDDKSCKAWEECNKLHQECLKENLKHMIVMSGRGYHLYILTMTYKPKNAKSTIYNSQMSFINRLNLPVDKQVIGNPAQLARVPNTYNTKGERFCIPLTQEQFEKGDIIIKQLAKKQNFVKDIVIGNKLLNLEQFDYETKFDNQFIIKDETESSGNLNYESNLPESIRHLLNKKEAGWRERYLIILYFKEKGYTRKEVYEILKGHLSERKFKHCIVEERQLQYLFERDDLVFPENETTKIYK